MTAPRLRAPRRGVLIVIEGIDGAGKSTLQRTLARRWRSRGWSVRIHREPGDPALGRAAQRLSRQSPVASAVYFTFDRLLDAPKVDRWIDHGEIVLQDRSFYSTLAYQSARLSAGERRAVDRMQRLVAREPDKVLWIDVTPEQALRRLATRGGARSPLERSRVLRQVDRAYRRLFRAPRWVRLDGSAPAGQVADAADRALAAFLRRRAVRTGRPRF